MTDGPIWPPNEGAEAAWWSEVLWVLRVRKPELSIPAQLSQADPKLGAILADHALPFLPHLRSIQLMYCASGDDGVSALARRGLRHCAQLQSLDLTGNNIGIPSVRALAEGLRHCPELRELLLNENTLALEAFEVLADQLLPLVPQLQSLGLSRTDMQPDSLRVLAERGLPRLPELESLDLTSNPIGLEGMRGLASQGFRCCSKLSMLSLQDTMLCDEAVRCLAQLGLAELSNVDYIDLARNRIGDDGVEALAAALECFPKLEGLFLHGNRVGSRGLIALADSLPDHCPLLQDLRLMDNCIGDDGVLALCRRLRELKNLQVLHLKSNRFGEVAAAALVEIVGSQMPMSLQDLSGVSLGRYGEILALPKDLRSEENVSHVDAVGGFFVYTSSRTSNLEILGFLREHPTIACRRLFASEQLQGDKAAVLDAVKEFGRAIRYATAALRADKEVVLAAVESSGNSPRNDEETQAKIWEELQSHVDQAYVQRMRAWCERKHGKEAAASLHFHEMHAQYVSFPGESTSEELDEFPELGWVWQKTLQPKEDAEVVCGIP